MSGKYKKKCKYLNYVEHLLICFNSLFVLILVSTVTDCVSISTFASLFAISVGITSSAQRKKNCAIRAGIKKYK